MKLRTRCAVTAACLLLCFLLMGCSQQAAPPRPTRTTFLVPECAGEVVYSNDLADLDASRTADGYIMLRYNGQADGAKVQITIPEGTVYTYSIAPGNYETFPLTGGDGEYCVDVLENAGGDLYALVFTHKLTVRIADEFSPYLYPNQYVWYTPDSPIYGLGVSLSEQSVSDLDYVEHVYEYIISTIDYDDELAERVKPGYIPDLEHTLDSGAGICFDYASLMTALLRTQGIPTKLVIGYSDLQYHAWIDVYLEEKGWVSHVIYFDGSSWSIIDPTLGPNNTRSDVKKYVGDDSHYQAKYFY